MESGPGPPANTAPSLQTPHSSEPSELMHAHAPQLSRLPLFPSWPPFAPLSPLSPLPPAPSLPPLLGALQLPPVPQAAEALEVIDLTGLSDEDEGDDWEDVPEVVDLTNLPSSDEDEATDHDDVPQNYTILNLPPRRFAKINFPPPPGQTPRAARRAAARAARAADRKGGHVPAPVPVRRAVCELCARIVRWGPGVLITKHHLYPQQVTKKYPEKYTLAQKKSIALLCRPCHDACHKVFSNRILADFYYEVDLLKADPNIQAHVRSMQRATTPELIQRYGDGVHVRRRKERMRAAQEKLIFPPGEVRSRLRQRETAPPPPSPPGARRSARLLAKTMGDQAHVPVIVIEDEDQDMQDLVIHEEPNGNNNEKMQDAVSKEELAALESLGEYIRL